MMRYELLVVFVASTSLCGALTLADPTEQNDESHDSSPSDATMAPTPTLEPQPACKENEVTHPCTTSYCLKKYCYQEDMSPDCVYRDMCYSGCICKEGYLFERNFTCVPVDQCYKPNLNITCADNEIVSKCSNGGCGRTNCSEIGTAGFCRDVLAGYCEPGCVCKSDYLRAANGTCVPIEECPKNEYCTKPHEYYNPCPPRCPSQQCYDYLHNTLGDGSSGQKDCPPQPQPGDPSCFGECYCEEGFYRNYNQDCVPFEDCSKVCSGKNEILVAYPESCEPQLCDGVSITNDHQIANNTCRSVCRCLPGFARNKHGECIAKENCGKCQGPNEHFACSTGCDNVCSTLDKQNRTNCPDTEYKEIFGNLWGRCTDMCYCDDGFARDLNNTCIPVSDCPSVTENKLGETHFGEASHRPVRRKKRCIFQSYNEIEHVPETCGENEIFTQFINAGCGKKTCSDIGRPYKCIDTVYCIPGCICKDEYLRAANGTCVPINDCPKNEICAGPHEYYDICPPTCPSQYCYHFDSGMCPPQPKPGDPSCEPGCRCEEGFSRNTNHDCVLSEDCLNDCSRINSELISYPESCEPQTCDGVHVSDNHTFTNKTCTSQCRCLHGFVKNKFGVCIEEKDCGKCKGPNEIYSCNSACDNVCATLDKMNRTDCPIDLEGELCVYKCYCDDGFARDSNNICIPVTDCPKFTSQDSSDDKF